MSHYGLRVYAISITAIVLIWTGILLWGARELSHAMRMSF
jgi:hypothetical protein